MRKISKKFAVPILVILFISAMVGFNGLLAAQAVSPTIVNLGAAGNFTILAKTGVTTTGATSILGNVGVSPAAANTITGFGLVMDSSNNFSTSSHATGKIYAADYAAPTPGSLTTAVSAMEAAYTDAAGRPNPTATEVDSGNLSSTTPVFVAGIYKWSTDVNIQDHITLSGNANDVWIFQIAQNLNLASTGGIASGTKILLTGGAKAENVFWQVGGGIGTTLGTYSTFNGNILSLKQVVMQTGAVFNGRALSQSLVTLDADNISSSNVILNIVKVVVNDKDGSATPASFMIHVKNSNIDVIGSPSKGTSTPGTPYSLSAGSYVVSEDANSSYTTSYSGDCDVSGNVTLSTISKTCTVTNTSIPVPAPVISGGGGGPAPILPFIGITKTPDVSFIALAPKAVTYSYKVWNVGKNITLANINVVDDKCGPLVLVSGDLNNNNKIEANEIWNYTCTSTLSKTTTNVATATGYSDDPYHQMTTASATATVNVGTPVVTTVEPTATSTPVVVATTTPIVVSEATTTPILTVTPDLPNAGVAPENNNSSSNIVMLIGSMFLVLTSLALVLKMRKD